TNWVRQATGALSIAIFSSLLASRALTHQKELSGGASAAGALIKAQGMTMGVQDVFLTATVIGILAIPLTFLLRTGTAKPQAAVRNVATVKRGANS
ncbi:MFS transporter, partial [Paenibacillus riograndensis]